MKSPDVNDIRTAIKTICTNLYLAYENNAGITQLEDNIMRFMSNHESIISRDVIMNSLTKADRIRICDWLIRELEGEIIEKYTPNIKNSIIEYVHEISQRVEEVLLESESPPSW